MNKNRVKVIYLQPDWIMGLLGNWKHEKVVGLPLMDAGEDDQGNRVEIPAGYTVEQVSYEWHRRRIAVLVAHHDFEEVPDGMEPPVLRLREATVHVREIQNPGAGVDEPVIVEKQP